MISLQCLLALAREGGVDLLLSKDGDDALVLSIYQFSRFSALVGGSYQVLCLLSLLHHVPRWRMTRLARRTLSEDQTEEACWKTFYETTKWMLEEVAWSAVWETKASS